MPALPQRFLQNILRFYVFVKLRRTGTGTGAPLRRGSPGTSSPPASKTTSLLFVVFAISTIRKLRALCELLLLIPFNYDNAKYLNHLSAFAGSLELNGSNLRYFPSRNVASSRTLAKDSVESVSSTRWLWTRKFAWEALSGSSSGNSNNDDDSKSLVATTSVYPPASDERSLALRWRLEGLETSLSLLDTISDGIALFARLGLTMQLPLELLRRHTRHLNPERRKTMLEKLFYRAETLADLFWLLSSATALAMSEWERREVWNFGRRVRRAMRKEENERNAVEQSLVESMPPGGGGGEAMDEEQLELMKQNEERLALIRHQRRTLRDLRGRLSWLWWERLRLGADIVFATYDVFEFSRGSEAVRAIAGVISAGVGFSQVSGPV